MSSRARIYSLVAAVLVTLVGGGVLFFYLNSPIANQQAREDGVATLEQQDEPTATDTTEEQQTTQPENTKQEKTESSEQTAAEQEAAEREASERATAEHKAAEEKTAQEAAEQQAAEQAAAERRAAEQAAQEQQWREIAERREAEERDAAERRAAEQQASEQRAAEEARPTIPTSTALSLSAPTAGIQNNPVTDSVAESVLSNGAGKIPSTGFPWQAGSNTYIAAHVYGYPGTGSWQQFARVPNMSMGDPIYLTDSNGTTYEYQVNEILTVAPTDVWAADSTGQTSVSLQTCVGPDWSERLVVRGTLVGTSQA